MKTRKPRHAATSDPSARAPAPGAGPPATMPVPVRQVLQSPRPQPKLMVSRPGDASEREADQVADHVMRQPAPGPLLGEDLPAAGDRPIGRPTGGEIHRKRTGPPGTRSDASVRRGTVPEPLAARLAALGGGGEPMPPTVRSFFEPRFGRELGDVRLHTDPAAGDLARSLDARAFTLGNSIVFGPGEYAPGSAAGRHLIAHELTHVLQQRTIVQRDELIDVEIIEIPRTSLTVEEIVTDTLRTSRACLMNFNTALENFSTRITAESGQEAAPKEPAAIVMREVGKFAFDLVLDGVSTLPGGAVARGIVELGRDIEQAVTDELARSAAAGNRNAAANFVMRVRSRVNEARTAIETNMTEDISAARRRHESAESEGHRDAIRTDYIMRRQRMDELFRGPLREASIFRKIVEAWIRETQGERASSRSPARPARVVLKLDGSWSAREAYIDAPFGSRLAEHLQSQGTLDVRSMSVPRLVIWFPFYGTNDLVRCYAEVNQQGTATRIWAMGVQSQGHLQRFIELLSSRPLPTATRITGTQVP